MDELDKYVEPFKSYLKNIRSELTSLYFSPIIEVEIIDFYNHMGIRITCDLKLNSKEKEIIDNILKIWCFSEALSTSTICFYSLGKDEIDIDIRRIGLHSLIS